MDNNNGNSKTIIIVLFGVIILGLSLFIVYDKFLKEDKKVTDNTSESSKIIEKTTVEFKKKSFAFYLDSRSKMIYVNNNRLELNSSLANDLENSFTQGYIVSYDLGNILYIDFGGLGWHDGIFVDENGKIVKAMSEVVDANDFIRASISNSEYGAIYFEKSNLTKQDDSEYCEKLASNKLDDEMVRIDKVTYMENGEFQYEKGVESRSFREYSSSVNC